MDQSLFLADDWFITLSQRSHVRSVLIQGLRVGRAALVPGGRTATRLRLALRVRNAASRESSVSRPQLPLFIIVDFHLRQFCITVHARVAEAERHKQQEEGLAYWRLLGAISVLEGSNSVFWTYPVMMKPALIWSTVQDSLGWKRETRTSETMPHV